MKSNSKTPIVRFAPSPTGLLHMGGVRSALFNYLFAKKNGGTLMLRIEDTDTLRSKKEYERDIFEGFSWLGISFDETVRQSDRVQIHTRYLEKLIADGYAYISKEETPPGGEEEGRRTEVIRFKNKGERIQWHDLIKGDISFDTSDLGDFVIAKSITEPLFHLAVVVDDFEMGITHVVRGEDHISNTPRQILIQRAIGAPTPEYGHIPLLLATDRTKLSKRKHGESVSLTYYRKKGYLPSAILNYLALLGWNPGTDQEFFTLDELISAFDLSRVQKGNAVFDVEKLNWMNKEYIKHAGISQLATVFTEKLTASGLFPNIRPAGISVLAVLCADRARFEGELDDFLTKKEFSYITNLDKYLPSALLFRGKGELTDTKHHLMEVRKLLEHAKDDLSPAQAQHLITPYAEIAGKGAVLWPLRFALSGQERSIDPWSLISILGTKESISRIDRALSLIQ